MKLHVIVAALTAAALFSSCGKSEPAPQAETPAPITEARMGKLEPADDAPLPELKPVDVVDAAGVKKLLEGARGKVAVMNFWATWCPPCVEEMPYFVQLYNSYNGKGVELISISGDGKENLDSAVRSFQKDRSLPFAIHVISEQSPEALDAVLTKELTGALPETLIYDKDGKLAKQFEGPVTQQQLEDAVKALL